MKTECPTTTGDVGSPPVAGTVQAVLTRAMLPAVSGESTARREFEESWSGEGHARASPEVDVAAAARFSVDAPLTQADPSSESAAITDTAKGRLATRDLLVHAAGAIVPLHLFAGSRERIPRAIFVRPRGDRREPSQGSRSRATKYRNAAR